MRSSPRMHRWRRTRLPRARALALVTAMVTAAAALVAPPPGARRRRRLFRHLHHQRLGHRVHRQRLAAQRRRAARQLAGRLDVPRRPEGPAGLERHLRPDRRRGHRDEPLLQRPPRHRREHVVRLQRLQGLRQPPTDRLLRQRQRLHRRQQGPDGQPDLAGARPAPTTPRPRSRSPPRPPTPTARSARSSSTPATRCWPPTPPRRSKAAGRTSPPGRTRSRPRRMTTRTRRRRRAR